MALPTGALDLATIRSYQIPSTRVKELASTLEYFLRKLTTKKPKGKINLYKLLLLNRPRFPRELHKSLISVALDFRHDSTHVLGRTSQEDQREAGALLEEGIEHLLRRCSDSDFCSEILGKVAPYVFEISGAKIAAHCLADFIEACVTYPYTASQHLLVGYFEPWLRECLVRDDLADAATSVRDNYHPNTSRPVTALWRFLKRTDALRSEDEATLFRIATAERAECPACHAEIDINTLGLEPNDQLTCEECESQLTIVSVSPLEVTTVGEEIYYHDEYEDDEQVEMDATIASSIHCPICDAVIGVDEEELEPGDALICDECGTELDVSSIFPLQLVAHDDQDGDGYEDEEEDSRARCS